MIRWVPPRDVHPLAGILSGCALILACLVLPVSRLVGSLSLIAPVAFAFLLFRPSPLAFLRLLGLTLTIYIPMLLVLPRPIVAQGAATAMTGVLSMGSLGYAGLYDVITHLPLPGMMKLLLLQTLHQASVLFRETAKIRQAMLVRGAVPKGLSGWQFLHALPRVWIPRVIFKADRVAHALELRGYGTPVPPPRSRQWHCSDAVLLLVSAVVLAAAFALRWVQ